MNTQDFIKTNFGKLGVSDQPGKWGNSREAAYQSFLEKGIPGPKHEEWKYTHVGKLFNKNYTFEKKSATSLPSSFFDSVRLPGSQLANELIFVNGVFTPDLSTFNSKELNILSFADAANTGSKSIIDLYYDISSNYIKDGIQALNTAFAENGYLISIEKNRQLSHPVYIYQLSTSGEEGIFSQPRLLVHLAEGANAQFVETSRSSGTENFINKVTEVVLEDNAHLEYYQVMDDTSGSDYVNTLHIHQAGKSTIHTLNLSLAGNMVRNNLNIVMDAPGCEARLFGLYYSKGQTHIDNHTLVDNRKPSCLSNELYKGIIDDESSAVFNGKIFVQPLAQKTNAYQSNKNILLSESGTVNAKPQLEIFADDVKCSHGCTVGRLDEEGLFYLRSRGIEEKTARGLMLFAFAEDILKQVHLQPLREFMEEGVSRRLLL